MLATATQGHPRGTDRLHRTHRIPLNTGHLHQATDRVTGQAEVMFHCNFCSVLYLSRGAAEGIGQGARRHRAGRADLSLAADLGARDGGVDLVEDANRACGQQEAADVLVARATAVVQVVLQHSGNNPGRAIGGRRHNPATDRVLLVHRQGIQRDPVHGVQRLVAKGVALALQLAIQLRRPPFDLKATGHNAFGTAAAVDTGLHDLPERE